MIGVARRPVARPAPGAGPIVGVDAEAFVHRDNSSVHGLVPLRTAPAELLREVASRVREGRARGETLVAPAEESVTVRGIVAERRTAELEIARVVRSVDCEDDGCEQSECAG